jgi:hypothetical protein
MTLLSTAPLLAQTSATKERTVSSVATQLFSAPDESSPQAGTLAAEASATPIAERWVMVQAPGETRVDRRMDQTERQRSSKKLETFQVAATQLGRWDTDT